MRDQGPTTVDLRPYQRLLRLVIGRLRGRGERVVDRGEPPLELVLLWSCFHTTHHHLLRSNTGSEAWMRLLALLLLTVCAQALHSYEAGVTDWHKSLAGVPLAHLDSTAPRFHRRKYEDGSSNSVVLTATQSNVLAALHSANGTLGE